MTEGGNEAASRPSGAGRCSPISALNHLRTGTRNSTLGWLLDGREIDARTEKICPWSELTVYE